jgi:acyl-coenzyme A thioesterase PaaI-like protein
MTPESRQLLDAPFEGCTLFDRESVGTRKAVYVSGDPDPDRLLVRYWVRDSDNQVFGRAHFGPLTQGPPLHAHGGSMAALLDEAMGICAWVSGHPVLAAELNLRFRKSLPLNTVPKFHAWVHKIDGRKVHTKAVLLDEKGGRYADATGLFMILSTKRMEEMKKLFFASE